MPLFGSIAQQDVIKALERSARVDTVDLKQWRESLMSRRRRIHNMYEGGTRPRPDLKRRLGESETSWRQRLEQFMNVRFVYYVVESYRMLMYGAPPKREAWLGERPPSMAAQVMARLNASAEDDEQGTVENREDDLLQEWFKVTYEENKATSLFSRGNLCWFLDGVAPLKAWVKEDVMVDPTMPNKSPIRMDFFDMWDALPVLDPDDPDTILAVYEIRQIGRNDYQYRLWNDQRWDFVDASGQIIGEGGEHNLGRVPWSFLGDVSCYYGDPGLWLDDAVLIQDRLINRDSVNWLVARSQGFGIPVLKGDMMNQEVTKAAGERGIRLDLAEMVALDAEQKDSNFWFANPNADITALREVMNQDFAQGLRMYGLPDNVTAAFSGAEQPMAMKFRWQTALSRRDALVEIAKDFEQDVADAVARWIDRDFMGVPEEDFQFQARFPKDPFGEDKRSAMKEDANLVDDGLMLPAAFVQKYSDILGLGSDPSVDEVVEYVRALQANRQPAPEAQEVEFPGLEVFGGTQ